MKTTITKSTRDKPNAGFVLVAVLWIMGALAALASVYAMYVVNSATSLAAYDDRLQTENLIRSGLELTAYRFAGIDQRSRPARGAFTVRVGRATIAADFRSEAGRIDLNEAPAEFLAGLFVVLGASEGDAINYAARIDGWRTGPEVGREDDEASLYRALGLPYSPRGGRFAHVEELRLLAGVPHALLERAMPFVTIFNGRADVDVAVAAPEVIAALSGSIVGRLNASNSAGGMAGQTAGPAGASAQQDGPGPERVGQAIRNSLHIVIDNGRRINAEVVIFIPEEGDEPYNILSWQDDFDQSAAGSSLGTLRQ